MSSQDFQRTFIKNNATLVKVVILGYENYTPVLPRDPGGAGPVAAKRRLLHA
jgi:hypothetical protein